MFVAGALAAALLVGCTGSGHRAAAPATTPSPHTTIASTKAPPTSTSSTSTSPTTVSSTPTSNLNPSTASAPAGTPQCLPDNLRATASPQGGTAGHVGEVVTLTLVGNTACTTGGYLGLDLRNAAGASVLLGVHRQTQAGFLFPYVSPATIVVAAAAPASFGIEWTNEAKLAATTLVVILPNSTSPIVVTGADTIPNNPVVTITAVTTARLPVPATTSGSG